MPDKFNHTNKSQIQSRFENVYNLYQNVKITADRAKMTDK